MRRSIGYVRSEDSPSLSAYQIRQQKRKRKKPDKNPTNIIYREDMSDLCTDDIQDRRNTVIADSEDKEDKDYCPDSSDPSSTENQPQRKRMRKTCKAILGNKDETYSFHYDSLDQRYCKTYRERRKKKVQHIDDGDERSFQNRIK